MDVKELLKDLRESIQKRLGEQDEARTALDTRLAELENNLRKYTAQTGNLGNAMTGDPHYKGMWPNEKSAADFGALCMAIASPEGSMRARAAKRIAEGGYTIRKDSGQFADKDAFVKDLGISTDTAGGYLTPDEMASVLIRNVETFSVFRSAITRVPMASGRQTWPKRTGGFTVYYPDESEAATPSDLTLGQVALTAKKWAVLTFVSKELEEDSLPILGELIALEFALALARAEETNGFMGDGTSTFAGIVGVLNSPNVAAVPMGSGDTSFADVTEDDLISMITAVPSWAKLADAAFYASPEIVGILMKIKDDQGRPIYNNPVEGFPFKIQGYPVREATVLPGLSDDAVSTPFIAFGSLRLWGILGVRRAMSLERSDEVRKLQGQTAILAMPRQDIQETDGDAMAVLQTAAA